MLFSTDAVEFLVQCYRHMAVLSTGLMFNILTIILNHPDNRLHSDAVYCRKVRYNNNNNTNTETRLLNSVSYIHNHFTTIGQANLCWLASIVENWRICRNKFNCLTPLLVVTSAFRLKDTRFLNSVICTVSIALSHSLLVKQRCIYNLHFTHGRTKISQHTYVSKNITSSTRNEV